MRPVAVLALDGVVGFDLAIPGQVFGTANLMVDSPVYEIRIAAPGRCVRTASSFGALELRTEWGLEALEDADTIVVPGLSDPLSEPEAAVLDGLRAAWARGVRITSVCNGAFVLAAAGLLDGRRATTHWQDAAELARRYPRVTVDPAVLYVEDGNLCTSAGVAAGLDMCLHLVRNDLGAAVAADTARHIVMPPQRQGGQAQFIVHPDPGSGASGLGDTLHWMTANLDRPLTLAEIADHAALSVRSLNRHFRAQVGTTPLQWLLHARIRYARELLETTDHSVEIVARRTGFATATAMRHHFTRHTGIAPHHYRANFRTARPAESAHPARPESVWGRYSPHRQDAAASSISVTPRS